MDPVVDQILDKMLHLSARLDRIDSARVEAQGMLNRLVTELDAESEDDLPSRARAICENLAEARLRLLQVQNLVNQTLRSCGHNPKGDVLADLALLAEIAAHDTSRVSTALT
jgi:hypothetical protein